MEALKLTRSTLKSSPALQTVAQSKRGRVIIGLASSANKSWRRINLDRRQMVVASLEYDGPLSTSGARYLQQKQVDLFIRPLTQFGADQDMPNIKDKHDEDEDEEMVVAKLRLVAAAAADRAEMHGVMAEQRDGWNKLLLSSLTNFTLAALILQSLPSNSSSIAASLLYGFSAALMCGVNKIQPSQLAEEQRMAARLFRKLENDIHTNLALPPHLRQERSQDAFLCNAYEAVLALDEAYPLPLFPGMLNKFPNIVKPAVWWPQHEQHNHHHTHENPIQCDGKHTNKSMNGWSAEVEAELREVSETLKSCDIAEFVGLSRKVLGVNRFLAIAGPLLTGIAGALNMSMSGSGGSDMMWMSMLAGVLGLVGNTVSHGCQVGMVFEMYRNCAGFYHSLHSSISHTLTQPDPHVRENAELFRWRLALQLGRDPNSPLPAPDSASKFAGKLF